MEEAWAFLQGAMMDPIASSSWLSSFAALLGFLAFAGKLMAYLVVLAFGLTLKLIAPRYWERALWINDENVPMSFGVGLLGFIGIFLSALTLTLTIIGIPLAFLLVMTYLVLIAVGLALCGAALGARIPTTILITRPNAQLAVGVLALMLVTIIPFVGELVFFCALAIGTGALLRALWAKKPEIRGTPMVIA